MPGLKFKLGLEGAARLDQTLRELLDQNTLEGKASVVVGYASEYAVPVHEMPMKNAGKPRRSGKGDLWDAADGPGGHKFLERPARELTSSGELGRIVQEVYQRTGSLRDGLVAAGLRLQRESMELVPVEYGTLRATAFTEEEK